MKETRLFFVVDTIEKNEEIFTTLGEAQKYYGTVKNEDGARLYIGMVKNAYQEDGGTWNYEDFSDTFEIVQVLENGEIAKAMNRMGEIEEEAISLFLEHTDFNSTEWMNNDELKEYRELYKVVNGECPTCGETPDHCKC